MAAKVAGGSNSFRVRSAFAGADHHAALAAAGHRDDDSSNPSAWTRPSLLKLPSHSRSEQHWAGKTGDLLYYSPSATPQVENFRSLQMQFSHPVASPQVQTVRWQQEEEFRSPSNSSKVQSSRLREEGTFRAPPNTPQTARLRSMHSCFRAAPESHKLQLLRQGHEDPFGSGLPKPGLTAASSYRAPAAPLTPTLTPTLPPAQSEGHAVAMNVRQQMDAFRSQPVTPTLNAIRERLEAFVSDQIPDDPVKQVMVRESEDPFGSSAFGAPLGTSQQQGTGH